MPEENSEPTADFCNPNRRKLNYWEGNVVYKYLDPETGEQMYSNHEDFRYGEENFFKKILEKYSCDSSSSATPASAVGGKYVLMRERKEVCK